MPWLLFALTVYVAMALQVGLHTLPVWSFQSSAGPISPDLVMIIAIYYGLWASPRNTAWVMLILGLLVDLTTLHPTGVGLTAANNGPTEVAILGPFAVAYLVGAYSVVQARGLFYRDSPVAAALIVLGVGAAINLVAVSMLTARGFSWLLADPIPNWSLAEQLWYRCLVLVYTAIATIPLSYLLKRLRPAWGLEPPKGSHGFRR